MDEAWVNTPIDSTISSLAPKDLFSTDKVPLNSQNMPFYYEALYELDQDGFMKHTIILKDIDPDSPSYDLAFSYTI